MGFYDNYRKYNMTKQNDPFGFNKAINWDKLKDPKVLEELKKLFDDEMKKRRIKHNNLAPWFLEDHGALPAGYLKSCKKFFDGLKQSQAQKLTSNLEAGYKKIRKDNL
jgi:hypothetical protein